MKVILESTAGNLNFKGTNERGQSLQFSGDGQAVSPMESLLMAAAACSSIDVELILKKMRQDLMKIKVDIEGQRREDPLPKVFTSLHLHYNLYGKIKEKKAEEAVRLALEKYCSVTSSLHPSIEITSSFEIHD